MNLLSKISFLKQKPNVLITDSHQPKIAAVLKTLGLNDISVLSFSKYTNLKELDFFIKKAPLVILVLNSEEPLEKTREILDILPISAHLIFNSDIASISQLTQTLTCFKLSYGFEQGAQLKATDFHPKDQGSHFKLNFKGNILPIFLPQAFSKQTIYQGLITLAIAQVLNLNLVETATKLKSSTS